MGVTLGYGNPKQLKMEYRLELGVETQFSMFLEERDSENLHLYDVVKMMSVELSVLCSCTFCEEYEVSEMILEKILETKISKIETKSN